MTEIASQKLHELFAADKPIETRQEDLLGRRSFSEAIADAVRGWTGGESLVLSLYGAWGNGKSSIKNMVLDALSVGSPEILIVDFNPWQLANRPTLSSAFFDELGIALGKGDLGSDSTKKATLARFRRWANRLQGSRDLVHAIRNLLVVFFGLLGAITFVAGWFRSQFMTLTLGVVLLVAAVLTFIFKVVEALIKIFQAGTEVGTKSLTEIKAEIARDLKRLKAPILVVLDDLDRLTPSELLEVFQLIKANADFPNLIYLILCERAIVERNIEKILNVPGREYLEKIVQVAFNVPLIDGASVHQVLFQRLDELLASKVISARFSEKRWSNVFLSGLHSYFSTLRDVNRYVSTLSFHFSSFFVDGEFEVNPVDLIVLEAIRYLNQKSTKLCNQTKRFLRLPDDKESHSLI
jgi:predicted KAP-like P-loop ATPase